MGYSCGQSPPQTSFGFHEHHLRCTGEGLFPSYDCHSFREFCLGFPHFGRLRLCSSPFALHSSHRYPGNRLKGKTVLFSVSSFFKGSPSLFSWRLGFPPSENTFNCSHMSPLEIKITVRFEIGFILTQAESLLLFPGSMSMVIKYAHKTQKTISRQEQLEAQVIPFAYTCVVC